MIEFLLNDQNIRTDAPPGTALLDFIRNEQGLKGAKLVCREGECAACAVLAGTLEGGQARYLAMCSCIMPLANAHGKHIVTIEGLNGAELSPVQQAMVDCHGTQSGFCSPGFVGSLVHPLQQALTDHHGPQCGFSPPGFVFPLAGALLASRKPGYGQLWQAIDGNICRCTGYKSIERAVRRIADGLPDEGCGLETLIGQGYVPAYFRQIPARLAAIAKPLPAEAALPAKETAAPPPLFLGGGTDLLVQIPQGLPSRAVTPVFDAPALKGIREEGGACIIGAATTATELQQSSLFQSVLNPGDQFFELLSSTPIRNMSTVGGNLMNASPIGDFTILFLALDSSISLQAGGQARAVKLKDFYLAYKKMDRRPVEYLASIRFEMPKKEVFFSFEKVCTRRNLDIASVNTAAALVGARPGAASVIVSRCAGAPWLDSQRAAPI